MFASLLSNVISLFCSKEVRAVALAREEGGRIGETLPQVC